MFNYFLDAFRLNFANFTGRARREEFWSFTLFNFIFSAVFTGSAFFIFDVDFIDINYMSGIYSLIAFVPTLAIQVRRLHDVGKSGWFILITLIPLFGWIWLLILDCTESVPGPNKWGLNPKGIGNGNIESGRKSIEPKY